MTPDKRTPDYRAASIILWLATGVGLVRKANLNFEVIERLGLLCDEVYQAIAMRGARVGDLVEAVRAVRKGGSILDDLPVAAEVTKRQKPPMPVDE